MKPLIAFLISCAFLPSSALGAGSTLVVPLANLEAQARSRTSAVARVALAPPTADVFRGLDAFEPAGSGHIPNYLRALAAVKPLTAKPFAHLL